MVETAGSCGYLSFKGNSFAPTNRNQIAFDPSEYLKNSAIIKREEHIKDFINDFLEITKPTIFYNA